MFSELSLLHIMLPLKYFHMTKFERQVFSSSGTDYLLRQIIAELVVKGFSWEDTSVSAPKDQKGSGIRRVLKAPCCF